MEVQSHGKTHQGRVRPGNEDALFVGRWVYAVADGVGGAPAGEVASTLAVEQVAAYDDATPEDIADTGALLGASVRAAARTVAEAGADDPARTGMATTLTAAAVWDDQLVIAHVGDSRAYLLRDGLEQLTNDHTAVEEAVQVGLLDRADAARHPERHLLVRVVGMDPDVPVADYGPWRLQSGDRVLLCSDGLTEACETRAIARHLEDARDPESACEALIRAALEGGGPDNVTVVVLDLV